MQYPRLVVVVLGTTLAFLGGLGAIAACVGDEPAATNVPGTDGSSSLDDAAGATDGPTSSNDGGITTDGACNLAAQFLPAEPLGPTINTQDREYAGRLSPDHKTLVFQRDVPGPTRGFELFAAPHLGDFTFGPAVAIDAVNGAGSDGVPSLAPDGTLIWEVERVAPATTESGSFDIWWAQPSALDGGFSDAAILTPVSSKGTEHTPYVVSDGHALFFTRSINGAPPTVLVSRRSGGVKTVFGLPTIVLGLEDPVLHVGDPVVTNNELVAYFKLEQPLTNQADIYRASRTATVEPFGKAEPLTELNTAGNDSPSWISEDECTILLARSPDGVTADLFVARRPK